MAPPADDPKPTPDSLFAAWLARHEAGEVADFEAVCREHPEQAKSLREIHGKWVDVEELRRQAGLGGSLSEKLKTRYGSGVDPEVTLEGEEQVQGDFSSEVISRLASRGPASTRYRVKGEVAHGGMGAVLRVWDEDLRRHLAMKVMLGKGVPPEKGDTPKVDPRMLARFLEEAQVTGQLDHPGIVPVHELGLDAEGCVYFTMKLVKGKTLKDVFDELARGEGGWTQTRVLGLILKVCEAMSYAHAKGVIHRDLKPANIMVGRFGEVFVMDWGLAKVLGREDVKDVRIQDPPAQPTSEVLSARRDLAGRAPDSPLYTMDGDVVGTPAYMPPEQAAGDIAAMGPPSDVYAIGAMLYHLLAGHMPYVEAGARLDNHAVWRRVQGGPPASLTSEARGAPAELIAICDKAMARDPAQRYSDMSSLAADLTAFVEGRVVRAHRTGPVAELTTWLRRNRAMATGVGLALAAILALSVGLSISNASLSDRNRQLERMAGFAKQIAVMDLVAPMRSLVAAQAQARQGGHIDRDEDGVGEYGWLQELCDLQVLSLTWMPNVSGATVEGGYNIRVFLPVDAQGSTWVGETTASPDTSPAAADARERQWIAYAWPIEFGRTGFLCMAVSEQGEILVLDPFCDENGLAQAPTYSGESSPRADAVLLTGSTSFMDAFGVAGVRNDGFLWKPLR